MEMAHNGASRLMTSVRVMTPKVLTETSSARIYQQSLMWPNGLGVIGCSATPGDHEWTTISG